MKAHSVGRRAFVRTVGGALSTLLLKGQSQRKPNIILIYADDLGYGDLGCYGSAIPTPNVDRMAREGIRLTSYYSASSVCSPSRAALLTGRYPVRTGITNVLMPNAPRGLDPSERTLPKILKEQEYRTACIGKWHLGNRPEFMPIRNGFDEFYGVPYSNDMSPLPMIKNAQVVDEAPQQNNLIRRLTEEAVAFIGRSKDAPFFMYLAHTAPHIPLSPSERFRNKSKLGMYGDVVTELDWSVGQILDALKESGSDENTLVVFTSDNGPWYQGSTGKLQGRKGSTYEGGVRVPFIARFPGRIPAGTVSGGLCSSMDLVPSIGNLCGATVPADSVDGIDIWPILSGEKPFLNREALLFFDGLDIQCVRWGPWKLHLARNNSYAWTVDPPGGRSNLPLINPELYHVDDDPAEGYDCAPENRELVASLQERLERLLLSLPDQVRTAWRDTRARRVQYTPVGALPRNEL